MTWTAAVTTIAAMAMRISVLLIAVIIAPLPALDLPLNGALAAHLQQLQVAPQIIGGSAIGAFRFEGETSSGLGERQAADCATLAPEAWHPQGYNEPFEKTAAETQQGDACLFYAPGQKTTRNDPQ